MSRKSVTDGGNTTLLNLGGPDNDPGTGRKVPPPGSGTGTTFDPALQSVIDEMNRLVGELGDLGLSDDGDGTETPPAPPGAPALTPPTAKFEADDIAVMCQLFMSKMDDLSMDTLNTSLSIDNKMRKDACEKAIKQIQEIAKKVAAAAKKQKMLGILGVIGKIFAVIAAAAMTLMTGGAAAPVAVALLAYTVVDLTMTVADKISQSKGGPSLSLDSLLSKGIEQLAKDCGASDDEAKEIGKYGAMAVQIAIAIAGLVGGAASFVGGGGNLLKLSDTAMQAVKVLNASNMALGGATLVASGGITIAKAFDDRSVADSRAQRQRLLAVADILKTFIDSTLDHMKALVQQQSNQDNQVSDILQSTAQSNSLAAGQPNHA